MSICTSHFVCKSSKRGRMCWCCIKNKSSTLNTAGKFGGWTLQIHNENTLWNIEAIHSRPAFRVIDFKMLMTAIKLVPFSFIIDFDWFWFIQLSNKCHISDVTQFDRVVSCKHIVRLWQFFFVPLSHRILCLKQKKKRNDWQHAK